MGKIYSVSLGTKLRGDLQCLPQEQNIRETGDIPPRNKPVSPPAVKKKKKKKKSGGGDLQCLPQQQSMWRTCSVSTNSKECGRPVVSPSAVKSVEDLQCLHQQ